LFDNFFIVAKDCLLHSIVDGVRHELKKRYREKIREKIAKKRAADQNSDDLVPKKMKLAYMVNCDKNSASATEEEMALKLSEEDLGTEDACRIMQCNIM
jgi:hypothetical protein